MISKTALFGLLTVSFSFISPIFAQSDVLDLTAADFDETLSKNSLVLAEFFAPWVCGQKNCANYSVGIARLWRQSTRKPPRNCCQK
jgi:hypothetical protein